MNWKSYAEKKNAETYVLPQGWDSRETIAEQLECSPDKVSDHLRPGLRAGEIQMQQFPVWDATLKRIVRVTAYAKAETRADPSPIDSNVVAKARELKAAGKSYKEIGVALGRSGESVRAILRRAA